MMLIRNSLGLFLLLLVVSCASQTPQSRQLAELFETRFEDKLNSDPEFRTYVGEKKDNDKLTDVSEAAQEKDFKQSKAYLETLKSWSKEGLSAKDLVSLETAILLTEQEITDYEFRFHLYPVNQMFGIQSELPSFMINMHTIESQEDALAYIKRLEGFDVKLSQVSANLMAAKEKKIIAPKFIYAKAYDDCRNITSGIPFTEDKKDSPLWEDFKQKLEKLKLSSEKEKELLSQAKEALLKHVKPGYDGLVATLKKLEKKAPKLGTALTLPEGKKFYQTQLQEHTTTEMTASEIHQLGLDEVKRIHGEMKKVMAKIDPKHRDLQKFFAHLKTDKTQKYANTEEGKNAYIKDATAFIDNMRTLLSKLFTVLPKSPLVVKAVEPYREKSAGLAFYEGPSEDGKRPGTYYVNLYDMDSVLKYEMEALAYHEAIPGHHMQVAIATEMEKLPRFRKYSWFTSFGEGWALYGELIPKEIGLYQDPYSDFGRLSMELWRATRLVVDTGLHAKDWSKKRATDYLTRNTPTTKADAVKAVERYIVMPGQATAYKVGMLKILQLREKAKTRLGDSFDLRRFHDVLLKGGTIPLKILEAQVDQWIEQQATPAE